MGQANKRGTLEERKAQALAKKEEIIIQGKLADAEANRKHREWLDSLSEVELNAYYAKKNRSYSPVGLVAAIAIAAAMGMPSIGKKRKRLH